LPDADSWGIVDLEVTRTSKPVVDMWSLVAIVATVTGIHMWAFLQRIETSTMFSVAFLLLVGAVVGIVGVFRLRSFSSVICLGLTVFLALQAP